MQENIKEIKNELLIKFFNIYFLKKFDIDKYSFGLSLLNNNISIWEINNNIVMQISESGNLIFSFQHYEKNRNEIKNILNDYLNKNVFHNLILKNRLEDKLPKKDIKKEKVKKI